MNNKKQSKEKIKRILAMACAILVALAFVISVVSPAMAAVSQEQIDEAKKKTEQAKKQSEDAEKKKEQARAEYKSIDNQISATEDEIVLMENQVENTKNDIVLKEEELKKAEEEYIEYEELFLKRAMVMYENSEIKYLEILFGASDFGDFLTKLEMISQLMSYDRDVLKQLDNTKKKIESGKKELENILVRQEENIKSLENRKVSLDETLAKKQELLDAAQKDAEKYKAIYEEAEAAEEALIKQNQAALSYGANPVQYTGGKFAWPVPGVTRISSKYGYRIHPIYKVKKFHAGIDIGAGYGINIVASADGVVTLATTNGGYGKCIIINHGSGLSTLYGHCSTLLVSKGEKVTRGQVIAKVGSTGLSTGPHLHYEVRVNGSTTDPMAYVTA